jgi:hypothetical protein
MQYLNKKFWEELIAYFPLIHQPHRKRRVQQFFYYCVCICCRGNVFTEPLPSNDRGIHIQAYWWKGFMKYAEEMGSGAMIYIPSFIKIGSGIQTLIGGGGLHKLTFIFSLFSLFWKYESRLMHSFKNKAKNWPRPFHSISFWPNAAIQWVDSYSGGPEFNT